MIGGKESELRKWMIEDNRGGGGVAERVIAGIKILGKKIVGEYLIQLNLIVFKCDLVSTHWKKKKIFLC